MAGKKVTFEQQIARLEEIVSALEQGDVELAASLALFEEGTKRLLYQTAGPGGTASGEADERP